MVHGGNGEVERAAYSLIVYWTKTARLWPAERRQVVHQALRDLTGRADFLAESTDRRYHLTEVDSSAHGGASLMALQRVLEALETDASGGPEDG
jgi:hypothetical protein